MSYLLLRNWNWVMKHCPDNTLKARGSGQTTGVPEVVGFYVVVVDRQQLTKVNSGQNDGRP